MYVSWHFAWFACFFCLFCFTVLPPSALQPSTKMLLPKASTVFKAQMNCHKQSINGFLYRFWLSKRVLSLHLKRPSSKGAWLLFAMFNILLPIKKYSDKRGFSWLINENDKYLEVAGTSVASHSNCETVLINRCATDSSVLRYPVLLETCHFFGETTVKKPGMAGPWCRSC